MRIYTHDGSEERRLVHAVIGCNRTLSHIAPHWQDGLLPSKWACIILKWCVDYFKNYDRAPGNAIESLYARWVATQEAQGDPDTIRGVEAFLGALSSNCIEADVQDNPDFTVDRAARMFNLCKLRNLKNQLETTLDLGRVDEAQALVEEYRRVRLGSGGYTDLTHDAAAVREALDLADSPPLIIYPGALNTFFGRSMDRDGFIAYLAPEKRGKSWYLMDTAVRAMLQRRRVAFFSVGDMTRPQMERRLLSRFAKRPIKARTVRYPISISRNEDGVVEVEHQDRTWTDDLDWRTAWRALQSAQSRYVRSSQGYFRMVCTPAATITVKQIEATVMDWAHQGWLADVIVIDYADILAPPPGYTLNPRDGINATWMHLRALSQSLHCLVVTATQANTESYRRHTLDMRNFSEDKRKLSHVTGMVGINCTPSEKRQGLVRLNWLVLREDEFVVESCVHLAQCLHIANPAVRSLF